MPPFRMLTLQSLQADESLARELVTPANAGVERTAEGTGFPLSRE
jgi:hypothetical protein